ncbi:MAG TPA: hypothetical protein VG755_15240 [Nannocystaceae bacterium]|nr:hypothetical protein [Nannocystaceae bacterium]
MTTKLILALAVALAVGIPVATYARAPQTTMLAFAGPIKPTPGNAHGSANAKLTIKSLDTAASFTAQTNPKEVRVEKAIPWTKSKTSTGDQPEVTFTSAEGRTMSFELMFDTFEANTDVQSVYIDKLMAFALVIDPMGSEDKKRPPRVKVQWGTSALHFEGVVQSIDCKYTMFAPDGKPVRATCAVKLGEASRASLLRKK